MENNRQRNVYQYRKSIEYVSTQQKQPCPYLTHRGCKIKYICHAEFISASNKL